MKNFRIFLYHTYVTVQHRSSKVVLQSICRCNRTNVVGIEHIEHRREAVTFAGGVESHPGGLYPRTSTRTTRDGEKRDNRVAIAMRCYRSRVLRGRKI